MQAKNRVHSLFTKRMRQVFTAVALSATYSFAYQIITPFWTSTIDSALRVRDSYYKTILPDTTNFSLILLNKVQQDNLCQNLHAAPDSGSPWYNFVCAALQCNNDQKTATNYFTNAISLAYRDPGTTWVLFVECTRNRQTLWAERCLMLLEKQFLESGVRSAPAIAQQLLYYASLAEKQKDNVNANSFYGWAERFDHTQVWTILHRLKKSSLSNPSLFFSSLSALFNLFADSWPVQLAFAANFYNWISCFFLIFLIIVFVGLGLKHLPKTLHSFADRLPEHIPAFFKTFLPIAIIFSLISFGLLPFLWILSFLLWCFLDKKEKILVLFAILFLMLAPIDARIKDMFLHARMPKGPISLYARASQEGFSPDVYRLALSAIKTNPEDPLAQLSASLCAAKQDDTATAILCSQKALLLNPDDPVITMNAGNTAYLAHHFDTAIRFYQNALAEHPDEPSVRFNLAQSYARKSDTTADLDFVKILPQHIQNDIYVFVNTNNVYFARNWPPFRQLITPEYKPAYFWRHIFPVKGHSGSWETARSLWGASFLGIPPRAALLVFLALFALLMVWNFSPLAKRLLQQVSACRLCGRVLCDQCKKGELCLSCNHATQYIRNVKTLAAIQLRIRNNRKLVHRLAEYLLDICLPGSGLLYAGRRPFIAILPIIILTSAIYSSYVFLSSINLAYPHQVPFGMNENAPYVFIIYNGIFIIRALSAVFRRKGTVLS